MRSDSEGVIARARRTRFDLLSLLKRVCGMPDYHGYLAHMRERHSGSAVLSEREYFEQHMQVRYGSGVTRCC